MALKGLQALYNLILKDVVKGSGQASGIMSIGKDVRKLANKKFQTYITAAQKQGVDLENMSEQEIRYILELNKPKAPKVYSNQEAINQLNKFFPPKGEVLDMTGKKIDTSQGIMGGKSVKELMESGEEIVTVDSVITGIKKLEPIEAMKEANKVLKGEGQYKSLSKADREKIAMDESVTDHIFEREIKPDPEDMAQGGRASHYTGGMVDVEPNLSDIGHGSDALMARTRLVAPNSQATTSTGLNYLLAEDNDNIRVPFSKGKLADAARRKFMKIAGGIGAGIGALKTGIFGLGEKAAPVVEKTVETVQETPQYFFDLVSKIKMFGKKSKVGPQERVNEFSYTGKNGDEYLLTEDISTGDARIVKDKLGGVRVDEDEVVDGIADRSVMEYKSGKGMADESTKGTPPDEYDEYKVEFDIDGTEADADILEESVKKEIIEEATETVTKKADGGRIGFNKGKLAIETGRKFLEKVFGKENFENIVRNDPELHRGMLEVVEMFRNRDKEGLKMYLQKFLPHMDDATVEDFIIGGGGTEGIQGQLLRLGSGRDYAGKIEMMKKLERNKTLRDLDVSKMKPNAEGGLITMLGE
jgi:hypothetical protein